MPAVQNSFSAQDLTPFVFDKGLLNGVRLGFEGNPPVSFKQLYNRASNQIGPAVFLWAKIPTLEVLEKYFYVSGF